MSQLLERLQQTKPLILDGATGTEIDRRGVPTTLPLWSAGALNTHPEIVRQIHHDYLASGADIITTNTFRTHARTVRNGGEARRLTILAAQLAREAVQDVGNNGLVAGSVAPLEDCYSPHLTPHEGYCRREHAEMVKNLVDGGVDFCLIETMNTIHEATAAAGATQMMKIPFVMSFVLNESNDLLSGETLADAVAAITPYNPAAFMVNCIPTRHMNGALQKLRDLTDLPLGGYGNMGTPDDVVGWASAEDMTPETYCIHTEDWLELGLKIIGSCCGSSPEHTAELRRMVDSKS